MPDLLELESVEASHRAALGLAAVVTALVGTIVVPVLSCWRMYGEFLLPVLLCIFLLTLPVVWVVYRACTDGYYWKTDTEGITQHSLFRRRKIQWSQVTKAQDRRTIFLSSIHDIYGQSGHISILTSAGTHDWQILEASIWQHLRCVGKADEFVLADGPLSLWDTIPDAALEKVELNLRVSDETYIYPVLYLMLMAIPFVVTSEHRSWWPWIGLTALLGAGVLVYFSRKNPPARHYVLTPEYVEVLGHSPCRIPWTNITARSRQMTSLCGAVYRICSDEGHVDLLAPLGYDPDSLRAKLALIRHLREIGRTIMIPRGLRLPAAPRVNLPDKLDIRLPRLFVWFLPGVLTLLVGIAVVMPRVRPWGTGDTVMMLVISVSGWFAALAAHKYRIFADSEGITKTSVWGRKSVRWSDVAVYERNPAPLKQDQTACIKLKNGDGRLLLSLVPSNIQADWNVLTSYTDSKLSHLLPPPEEQPSWLARPFSK